MKSMTGYGRGEAQGLAYSVVVEMRSVNHRYLEIFLRLPRQLNMLEEALKKQIQGQLNRGKVDAFLTLDKPGGKKIELVLDKGLAAAYYDALIQIGEITGLPLAARAEDVAVFPGVLNQESAEDDTAEIAALAETALAEALTQLVEMREQEGQSLQADITARLGHIGLMIEAIAEAAPRLLRAEQEKLRKRIAELLEDIAVDEARLANEVAFLADRADISEELTRLTSHCQQFAAAFALLEPIGRRMDFLLQEMNREVNTIGSKANALEINNQVIEMKSALEKIREQVQNIE